MKNRALIVAFLSLTVFSMLALPCSAQNAENLSTLPSALQKRDDLKGLTGAEVKTRFGEPDEIKNDSSRSEAWYYGKSLIIFEDGKVEGWSDAGQLRGRENLAAIRSSSSDYDLFLRRWVNAWTLRKPLEPQQVVLDLMKDKDTSSK